MSTEELKLYLLLLVSAVRIGEEGQIAWEVLKRGLGESLTAEKIERLGEALGRHGLARVRVTYQSGAGRRERGDAAPVVDFTVFGLERLTGPRSGSFRCGREKDESWKLKGEKQ
ncbi:MAG: hypothetical protein HYY11_04025 [Candidatus Methylomirabilis oxyfera]|nr:hypothetical protein [Candidatus Methylomirabilis oxyfera]